MTSDEVRRCLQTALDGIEIMSNDEREKLIIWVGHMRDLGMWGLPGTEVMIGIHNKCVLECRTIDPNWDRAGFFVA